MVEYPRISCIMPTKNRHRFVAHAIELFKKQDYPAKELIIIDEHAGFGPLTMMSMTVEPNIFYCLLSGDLSGLTLGAKRNMACGLAHGDIIALWDDDDVYRPHRLSVQVAPLLSQEGEVSALHMDRLLRTRNMTLWQPSARVHDALFRHGVRAGTLMFWRDFWVDGLRFAEVNRGEDARYLQGLLERDVTLIAVRDPSAYICVRHGGNITDEIDGIAPPEWEQVALEDALSAEEIRFYCSLSAQPTPA